MAVHPEPRTTRPGSGARIAPQLAVQHPAPKAQRSSGPASLWGDNFSWPLFFCLKGETKAGAFEPVTTTEWCER
jgi:hypothetical protein